MEKEIVRKLEKKRKRRKRGEKRETESEGKVVAPSLPTSQPAQREI